MEPKPDWSFKKGNNETVSMDQSGSPIEKQKIDGSILDFIYEKLPGQARTLMSSDFTLEFQIFRFKDKNLKSNGFLTIVLKHNGEKIVQRLTGDDADQFVILVNRTLIPPESKN